MPICGMNTLCRGQRATVSSILLEGTMRRRMQDLGLIPGTVVECRMKSPAGDPVAYALRGTVVALRNRDAEQILVRPEA